MLLEQVYILLKLFLTQKRKRDFCNFKNFSFLLYIRDFGRIKIDLVNSEELIVNSE